VVKRRSRLRIVLSWLLLTFFATGQVIVYAHQHNTHIAPSAQKSQQYPRQTVSETCPFCDAMHFNYMALTTQVYVQATAPSYVLFSARSYTFTSISLILAGGRAPPVSNFSA